MSEGARAGPVMGAPPVSHHGIRAWALRRLRADLGNWRLLLVRTLTCGVSGRAHRIPAARPELA